MTDATVTPAAVSMCERLLADADRVGEALTAAVRRELPGYALLPEREHRDDVRGSLDMLLRALARGTGPTAAQLRTIESGARRRRAQGIPVHEVLAALQLVARLTWEHLHELDRDGPALVSLTPPLWTWMRQMTTTAAAVYQEPAGEREEHAVRRQRLAGLLGDGVAGDGRAAELARGLGFDARAGFTALVAAADAWSRGLLEPLQRELRRGDGVAHCGLHPRLMIVLVQGAPAARIAETVLALAGTEGRIGIGVRRDGMPGAAESVRDAELALAYTAHDRPVLAFEDVWLRATLSGSESRLEPLLATARRVAEAHPDLATAVIAFAKGGFSAVAAGELLHVHANTVRYRLNRWQELTGLDSRDFQGLVRSVLALSPWSV